MATNEALEDALIVADDAAGYPLEVLQARLEVLEPWPAIRRQLLEEIVRRALTAPYRRVP